ncbi:MAG: hypothetical protein PV344_07385, partial [Anaplasma sp.]|nr:hypothetical protein [Anaplasma sp.]
ALIGRSIVLNVTRVHMKTTYCKRLNFREDLIFANFANRLRFAKNKSREQFGQYINTTEATFDSRKLEPPNN